MRTRRSSVYSLLTTVLTVPLPRSCEHFTSKGDGLEPFKALRAATIRAHVEAFTRTRSGMKTIGAILAAALAVGSSCATRPDWIERTLVTVDVTGVWHGSLLGPGPSAVNDFWLDLRQDGPKAKGSMRAQGPAYLFGIPGATSGPIEGAIAGDVFSFKRTDGAMAGDLTVSGDEMTGLVSMQTNPGALSIKYQILLRRVGSSPRPDSPPR